MLHAARESGCKIGTDIEEKLEIAIKDGEDIDRAVNDAVYASISSAFMMVNAPKTFQLGNVAHIKERLHNAVKAWRGCDLVWRVRCQMESIRMARVSGLSKEDGVSAGEELVKCTLLGKEPSKRTLRIFHAAGMLSTTSYASRLGLAIDANLTTEVVKVLKGEGG